MAMNSQAQINSNIRHLCAATEPEGHTGTISTRLSALTLQADDAMAALKANSKLVLREEMMLTDSTLMRVWEH